MNTDEIIRALRICNNPKGHRCSECPVFSRYERGICKKTVDKAAADLIERLQGQLKETWEWDMYQCAKREIERLQIQSEQRYQLYCGALDTIERLESQLSASQARERAAIKEICALCRFGRQVGLEAGYQSTGNGCRCETCKWRGQQGGNAE